MDWIWCLAWHLAIPERVRGENALPPFWADSVLLCIHYSASFCSPFKSFPQFLPNFALLRFVFFRKVSHFVLLRLQWLGTRQHASYVNSLGDLGATWTMGTGPRLGIWGLVWMLVANCWRSGTNLGSPLHFCLFPQLPLSQECLTGSSRWAQSWTWYPVM